MSIEKNLNERIQPWNLLNHPFYQAWESGGLPVEALQSYAAEYGAFIHHIPAGWEVQADGETAEEEREHAELWDAFAAGLSTRVGEAKLPAVAELIAVARRLFTQPATALGALYAFEAQQPATAKSKLEGLRAHYSLPASVEPYFEVHSHNEHEAEKLLARMAALPASEQAQAAEACEQMATALWNALSDIYNTHCEM